MLSNIENPASTLNPPTPLLSPPPHHIHTTNWNYCYELLADNRPLPHPKSASPLISPLPPPYMYIQPIGIIVMN